MVVLDFFIVNVAMPAMQSDLHAGTGAIEWVVAGYGLTFATFLITAGRLGDQLGRRRMFSLGLALFTLASAACGLAPSPARARRRAPRAGRSPPRCSARRSCRSSASSTPAPIASRAISIYGIVLGLAAVGGQLIGGVLVQADIAGLGWRSCFLINVPIGLLALAIAARAVPESRVEGANRLDLVGTALITLGLVDIVLPLVEGRQHGWPAWTWLCLGAAPITLGLFAAHQRRLSRRGGAPLLDPPLFRERAFSAGLVTQLVFFCEHGVVLPGAGAVPAAGPRARRAAGRPRLHDPGRRLPGGLRLRARPDPAPRPAPAGRSAGSCWRPGTALLALSVADIGVGGSVALLVPGMLLEGAGMGLVITPLTSTVLGSLDPQNAGAAAGALSTMQQVGNALGVAVTGVIFFGALDGGFGHAFEVSLIQLALLGRGRDRADLAAAPPRSGVSLTRAGACRARA